MGYTDSMNDLSVFKVDCFAILSNKINELKAADMKKQSDKARAKKLRRR